MHRAAANQWLRGIVVELFAQQPAIERQSDSGE
jgi:hypothetical protein